MRRLTSIGGRKLGPLRNGRTEDILLYLLGAPTSTKIPQKASTKSTKMQLLM